jgi:hypothetical protein
MHFNIIVASIVCSSRLFMWGLPIDILYALVVCPVVTRRPTSLSLSLMLRPTVSRPVCLEIKPIWSLRPDFYYCQTVAGLLMSLTRGKVCRLQLLLALASAVIFGSSHVGLVTIFYTLRFGTSLFVASYESQGYGGGIRPRLHTGWLTEIWNTH